jgi:hypothetical protein
MFFVSAKPSFETFPQEPQHVNEKMLRAWGNSEGNQDDDGEKAAHHRLLFATCLLSSKSACQPPMVLV